MRPPVRVDHGSRLALSSISNVVRVMRIATGEEAGEVREAHSGAPANSTTPSPPVAGQSRMVRSLPPVSTVPSAAKATA